MGWPGPGYDCTWLAFFFIHSLPSVPTSLEFGFDVFLTTRPLPENNIPINPVPWTATEVGYIGPGRQEGRQAAGAAEMARLHVALPAERPDGQCVCAMLSRGQIDLTPAGPNWSAWLKSR